MLMCAVPVEGGRNEALALWRAGAAREVRQRAARETVRGTLAVHHLQKLC